MPETNYGTLKCKYHPGDFVILNRIGVLSDGWSCCFEGFKDSFGCQKCDHDFEKENLPYIMDSQISGYPVCKLHIRDEQFIEFTIETGRDKLIDFEYGGKKLKIDVEQLMINAKIINDDLLDYEIEEEGGLISPYSYKATKCEDVVVENPKVYKLIFRVEFDRFQILKKNL
jgi:hypothetical protein